MSNKTRPRGFIRKRKIKSGWRFYAYITHNGREVPLGGYSSQDRARDACRTAENEIAAGTFRQQEPEPEPVLTFAEFAERYLTAKSKSLKPSTLHDYGVTFRLHITPHFGERPLNEIERQEVQDWINTLKLSPATTAKTFRYFRAAMNTAEDLELLEKQPCRKIILPRAEHKAIDFLEPSEIATVLEYLDEPDRTFVSLLAYSGMRTGEAQALQWRNIDFKNHAVRIEKSWNVFNGLDAPKSNASRRAVPLLPHLEGILRDFFKRQGSPAPDAFLFFDGKKAVAVRWRFKTALKKAGLREVSIHSLRHGFASLLLSRGASVMAVQRFLGHGSAVLTLSVYSHLMKDDLGSAALAVNAAIAGADENVIALPVKRQQATA
jgi:integrase